MSLRLKVKADHNEYFLYSWGHSLRHSSYYGGPQLSRQNQNTSRQNRKPHGKTKNLTAKSKTLRQNQNTPRQNQKSHGKTKDLTAKPNTLQQKPNTPRQKQIPTAKPKPFCSLWSIWFCSGVFGFTVRYFVFAVRYFVFAVRFLVLPWHGCGPPYSSHMTQKKNVLTGIVSNKDLFLCSQNALLHALLVLSCLKEIL